MSESFRAAAAEILNRFPEIRWDRLVEDTTEQLVEVYGWIDRDDGRSDFVVFRITHDLCVGFTTSSAHHSSSIADRLYGHHDTHEDCQRVEEYFDGQVTNAVHLANTHNHPA